MSRVHDALRRAAQGSPAGPPREAPLEGAPIMGGSIAGGSGNGGSLSGGAVSRAMAMGAVVEASPVEGLLDRVPEIVSTASPDTLLIDPSRPMDAPTEEFRTLRTRLNHMQSL